ncbi:MAG: hypothetical protein ACOZQL_26985, partial [Myxococcota bacterium]
MSESDPQKPPEPELELARPARPPSQPPRVSNPNLQPVRSAARMQPLEAEARGPASQRIKEGAADTLLNSVSILGEVIEDFRNSDRFFKYKAMVLTLWGLLMIGSFGIACPGTGYSNEIGAVLVTSGEAGKPIYMVKNDGHDPWSDVEIVVNGTYRSTMSTMPAGGSATLSSAVLFDEAGKRAPATLSVTEIEVKVRDP